MISWLTLWLEANFSTILTAFLTSGVVSYLGRRYIEHKISKSHDKFKEELTRATEGHKADLSKDVHRSNLTFSRVDQDRSASIVEVYQCILRMRSAVNAVQLDAPRGLLFIESESWHKFQSSCLRNAQIELISNWERGDIYFDGQLSGRCKAMLKAVNDLVSPYVSAVAYAPVMNTPASYDAADVAARDFESGSEVLVKQLDETTTLFKVKLRVQPAAPSVSGYVLPIDRSDH